MGSRLLAPTLYRLPCYGGVGNLLPLSMLWTLLSGVQTDVSLGSGVLGQDSWCDIAEATTAPSMPLQSVTDLKLKPARLIFDDDHVGQNVWAALSKTQCWGSQSHRGKQEREQCPVCVTQYDRGPGWS